MEFTKFSIPLSTSLKQFDDRIVNYDTVNNTERNKLKLIIRGGSFYKQHFCYVYREK